MTIEQLKTKVFTSLGEASMCWSGKITGEFQSSEAEEIGNALMRDIEEYTSQFKPVTVTDGWISVKERLPSQATFVIAHKENGLVLGLYFNEDMEFKYGDRDQTSQITHWMPLPEPPSDKLTKNTEK